MKHATKHNVLIIGGGFGGVACALELLRYNHSNLHVRLISDKPHFEYHGALYRTVTGRSPLETCIPLRQIFPSDQIEVLTDQVTSLDLDKHIARGESDSVYGFDYLVLALGSQTAYHHIPGLQKLSFGFKSVSDSLRLKRHLHQQFTHLSQQNHPLPHKVVVVGGGASGTELSAELVTYLQQLSKHHHLNPSLTSVDLVQSSNRLLPDLPRSFTRKIEQKLKNLGVTIHFNQRVTKVKPGQIHLTNTILPAHTVIWTAGVTSNSLYHHTKDLVLDQAGKITVSKNLTLPLHPHVYVLGDSAATKWSGMAQTAMSHGQFTAKHIVGQITHQTPPQPTLKQPIYAIPAGEYWAAVLIGNHQYFGITGWILRRYLDWKVFTTILPFNKALTVFRSGAQLTESCPVCTKHQL